MSTNNIPVSIYKRKSAEIIPYLQLLDFLKGLKDEFKTLLCYVVLLFYVHGKHLRSCRDGQLTLSHFSWAGLDLLKG